MESLARPNRSDTHLSKEEENKIVKETKEHFEELAPKRHTKPQRSEYSSNYVDVNDSFTIIPEYTEFQRLENDQQKEEYKNVSQVSEEFVETDYYKDLSCVDKLHHTTGKGFIRMEDGNGKSYQIAPDLGLSHHASSQGNPATNDWIPSADDQANLVSDKPNRSDS
ncbi:Zinc transporter foi [Bienertia sinuspersici]